jgi:hypothetical protein
VLCGFAHTISTTYSTLPFPAIIVIIIINILPPLNNRNRRFYNKLMGLSVMETICPMRYTNIIYVCVCVCLKSHHSTTITNRYRLHETCNAILLLSFNILCVYSLYTQHSTTQQSF